MPSRSAIQGRGVVLVAHEPPGTEHLGIRLVAAALVEAGFGPRILSLLSPTELASKVGETLAAEPVLVGISVSDPLIAPMLLAYARLLRVEGYRGHVVAGGALATLERKRLLDENLAIDSVVRHAGELPIAELAKALSAGRALDEVPGLTTRMGDGRGNPQALLPTRLRPLRPVEPPTVMGIPKAELAASRGCAGNCAYCGVSALQHDLEAESERLGSARAHVHGSIRRSTDDIADEVAELYHRHGVRIGHLVDDNLLGPDPRAALAWLTGFERALAKRRVGTMAWRLMMEPRAISDEVAAALSRMGFLSVLVGFESLTARGLATLGRPGSVEGSLAARERLAARGVSPVVNVLALRPGGSLRDTRDELAAMARIDRFAWDLLPLTVWPGTRLASELAARGELDGQGAGLTWRPSDPTAERFLFALHRLRVGGLTWILRTPNVVETGFALRVAHRLGLAGATRERLADLETQLVSAQRVRRQILAQALAIAESPLRPAEFGLAIEMLAQQMTVALEPSDRALAALLDGVAWWPMSDRTLPSSRGLPSRWLAGTIFMTLAAGCDHTALSQHGSSPADAGRVTISDAAVPSDSLPAPDLAGGLHADAAPDEGVGGQVLLDLGSLPASAPDGQEALRPDSDAGLCDAMALGNAARNAPGGLGCDILEPATADLANYAVVIDASGRVVDLISMPKGTSALTGSARQAWLDAMSSTQWPCLAGQTVTFSCMVLLY